MPKLKSIIKKQPFNDVNRSLSYGNTRSRAFLSNSVSNIDEYDKYTKRQKELLGQVENHSFKDIELISIKSIINEASIKDPIEAWKSQVEVVDNTYYVKTLKKPYSMKWLNTRRLGLFLQSDLYLEFRLANILSQCDLDNFEQSK